MVKDGSIMIARNHIHEADNEGESEESPHIRSALSPHPPKRHLEDSGSRRVRPRPIPKDVAVVPPDGVASPVAARSAGADVMENENESWESASLHRALVGAILEIGIKQSSPAVIMEEMVQRPSGMTSERVKSHLQKFRQSKAREIETFLQEYDHFAANLRTVEGFHPRAAALEIRAMRNLYGGTAAAAVTHAVLEANAKAKQPLPNPTNPGDPAALFADGTFSLGRLPSHGLIAGLFSSTIDDIDDEYQQALAVDPNLRPEIRMPALSDEERRTSLGESICLVQQIIEHMTDHLLHARVS